MIELAALALFVRIASLGYDPVFATRAMPAGQAALRAILLDPDTYDGLARVRPSTSERLVVVFLRRGRRGVVRLTWILSPDRGTTEVDVLAQVETRGFLVRLGLLLGGRRALECQVEDLLAKLARLTVAAAEDVVTPEPEPEPESQPEPACLVAVVRPDAGAPAACTPISATTTAPAAGTARRRRMRHGRRRG